MTGKLPTLARSLIPLRDKLEREGNAVQGLGERAFR